jgi:hypothetical protein
MLLGQIQRRDDIRVSHTIAIDLTGMGNNHHPSGRTAGRSLFARKPCIQEVIRFEPQRGARDTNQGGANVSADDRAKRLDIDA